MILIRNSKVAGGKSVKHPHLMGWKMMGRGMEIMFCVSFLAKNLVRNGTIIITGEKNVEKWKEPINLNFHLEFDVFRLGIEMVDKNIQFLMIMRPYDAGVIDKSLPFFGVE